MLCWKSDDWGGGVGTAFKSKVSGRKDHMWRQSLNLIYGSVVNTWHANSRRLDLLNRKDPFKSYIPLKNLERIKPDFIQQQWNITSHRHHLRSADPRQPIISQELITANQPPLKNWNTSSDDRANWEANCSKPQIYMPLQIPGNNRAHVSQLNSKWGKKFKSDPRSVHMAQNQR